LQDINPIVMAEENKGLQQQAQNQVSFQGAKMTDIKKTLGQYRETIMQVMPKKAMEVDRIIAIGAQMLASNAALAKCEVRSVIGALIQCAITGLNPTPQYGEVYFIPYGATLQMQMGYRGWVKLAHKSGIVESVDARAVYEGDEFSFDFGTNAHINHKPGPNYGDASKTTHAYAIVKLRGVSTVKFEVLNMTQINRLKAKGQSGQAWKTDFDQMAKAKAVKQVMKLIPMEDEWRDVYLQDEAFAPSVDDFRRDGSGQRDTADYLYPQEPAVETNAEVVK